MGTPDFGPSKKHPHVHPPKEAYFEAVFMSRTGFLTTRFDDSPDRRNLVDFGVDIFAFFEARLFWAPFMLEMMLFSMKYRRF